MRFKYSFVALCCGPLLANDSFPGDPVVVTAPHTIDPLVVVTDPKKPRVPVPAMDGGGYLKNIAGFSVSKKGGAGNDPVFRGSGGSRLSILMDDTSFGGACGGRMDASPTYIFPESYDEITIIKGPQSVKHGGLFSAGVLFERKPLRFNEFDWFANFSGLYGSFGRYDLMADMAMGNKEGSIRTILTRSYSNDYKDGGGNKVHSAYRRNSATLIGAITPDSDTVYQITGDISDGRAAYSHSAKYGNDGRTLDRKAVNFLYQKENISNVVSKVKARAWYSYVDHIMDNFTMRPINPNSLTPYSLSNPNSENTGGRFEVDLTPTDSLLLNVGANYDYEKRQARMSGAVATEAIANQATSKPWENNMSFKRLNLFVESTYAINDNSKLLGGYGYGNVKAHRYKRGVNTEANKTDNLHNGFIRYEYDLEQIAPVLLYAGLGYVQRSPDYWERMKNFELKKERNTQLDIGAIYSTDNLNVNFSLFASDVKDYIILNWERNKGGQSKNVDARLYGGEVELSWNFARFFTLNSSLAYTYGQDRTDGKPLPQIPPLEFKIGIDYDDNKFLGGVQLRAASKQNRAYPNWGGVLGADLSEDGGHTAGFGVFSAYVGYKPTKNSTLIAGVDNLFNKIYAEHISKANAFGDITGEYSPSVRVNEPGRTLWLKAQVKF